MPLLLTLVSVYWRGQNSFRQQYPNGSQPWWLRLMTSWVNHWQLVRETSWILSRTRLNFMSFSLYSRSLISPVVFHLPSHSSPHLLESQCKGKLTKVFLGMSKSSLSQLNHFVMLMEFYTPIKDLWTETKCHPTDVRSGSELGVILHCSGWILTPCCWKKGSQCLIQIRKCWKVVKACCLLNRRSQFIRNGSEKKKQGAPFLRKLRGDHTAQNLARP